VPGLEAAVQELRQRIAALESTVADLQARMATTQRELDGLKQSLGG
jgi:hypothetical protein